MNGLLDGKLALVSGIGPGMGRDISLRLAEHGADIALGARTPEKVDQVAAEVEGLGRKALPIKLDITDRASCDAAVTMIQETFGHLDILVNNAFADGDHRKFESANLEGWHRTFDTNFFGTMQLTQAVVPIMKEQHDGRIVMINSMASVRPQFGSTVYAASKAALASATKHLALELGQYGIRVNAVHPGYIWGDSVRMYFEILAEKKGITFDEQYQSIAGETALGYLPGSDEIAGSVVFFASDLSKPVTGQALHVNAGHWYGGV